MTVNQPYHLFLDDERILRDVTWVELPLVEWTIVRKYNEFVQCITTNGLPKTISFDHDLAFEHYPIADNRPGRNIPYDTYKEKTGWHAAKWLVEYCKEKKQKLPKCFVHTQNRTGRMNILIVLDDAFEEIEKAINEPKRSESGIITL